MLRAKPIIRFGVRKDSAPEYDRKRPLGVMDFVFNLLLSINTHYTS